MTSMTKSTMFKAQTMLLMVLLAGVLSACGAVATPTTQPDPPTPTVPEPTATPATSAPTATEGTSPKIAASVAQLIATSWKWQETTLSNDTRSTPANPDDYTIQFFLAGGKISGKADCNTFGGTFTADPTFNLTINVATMTRMACPEGSLSDEYIRQLNEAATFSFQMDDLVIDLKANTGTMRFSPGDSSSSGADLIGKVWAWQNTSMNDGTVTTATNPDNYTLEFGTDGNVNVKADCNSGSGPYEVDGNQLTIGPVAMTMMACADNQDGVFLKGLNEVASYLMQGDDLILELKFDSGTMKFSPSGVSSAGSGGPASDLMGTMWTWQMTQMSDDTTSTPTNPDDYTLVFLPGGNATVKADCNSGSGSYEVDGNQLTLGPFAMTMMACPDGSLDGVFLKNLGEVASYLIKDGNLILELKLDSGTMTFAPAADAGGSTSGVVAASELAGKVWQWQETTMNNDAKTTPPSPANYTLEFLPTGKLNIKADCNMGGGPYTLDGNQLTIEAAVMTRMACPEGSLSDEYIRTLNNASSYLMDGENLIIELKLDSGTMKFAPGN